MTSDVPHHWLWRLWRVRSSWVRLVSLSLSMVGTAGLSAGSLPIEQAGQLEAQGRFAEAAALLRTALHQSVNAADRRRAEFNLDRLDRIRKDFPLTQDSLYAALDASLKDLTWEEFERWLAEGRFDRRDFDADRRFMVSSVSNLYWRHPELESRRRTPKDTLRFDHDVLATIRAVRRAAEAGRTPYVLPQRLQVTMTVTANETAVPRGKRVRAWMPVPRRYPHQTGFTLIRTSSPPRRLAAETSPIRSVLLEQTAKPGKPIVFEIEYEYTPWGVWFPPSQEREPVKTGSPQDVPLAQFTREAPHIVFTPQMRALAQQIAGDEPNPRRAAKRFYDWIAANIHYSYAIEYSTVPNLGEYCRERRYGDCGQETFLFLTLCRLRGIPARWQSGWNLIPGNQGIHDWCEIHVEPAGWIPVDPYMGIWATRYAVTLTPEERSEVHEFYFGGLDPYRMAANSDHCQELAPPKRALRSDTVDFQRGELEWGKHNLYFDQFTYRLQWVPGDQRHP